MSVSIGVLGGYVPPTRDFFRFCSENYDVPNDTYVVVWTNDTPVESEELVSLNNKVISFYRDMNYPSLQSLDYTNTTAVMWFNKSRMVLLSKNTCDGCVEKSFIDGYEMMGIRIFDDKNIEWYLTDFLSKFRNFFIVNPYMYPFIYKYMSQYGEQLNPFIRAHYEKKLCHHTNVAEKWSIMDTRYDMSTVVHEYQKWREYIKSRNKSQYLVACSYLHEWWYSDNWLEEFHQLARNDWTSSSETESHSYYSDYDW